MKSLIFTAVLAILGTSSLLVFYPANSEAHPGSVNSSGCHYDDGYYHCH